MLSHPNIVSVYDVSRSSPEYIVMELIDGITLKQYMERRGRLNWRESLHFITQIMKGLSHAQEHTECHGMGTTLVSAVTNGSGAVICNVGDSRAYRVGTGRLERITRDHSVVEGLIESGNITAEQARTHPNRNLITRALGPEEHIECDVYDVTLGADERLLLCSDGLVVTATDEEMYEAVARGEKPAESLEHLLELSKQRGAPDNVTAVLLYHE